MSKTIGLIYNLALIVSLLVATVLLAADDKPRTITFGKADDGKLPKGWTTAQTGMGTGSVWKVVEDGTAPSSAGYALSQTTEGPKESFNLCILDGTKYTDVSFRVAFKVFSGKVDQGGGVVWRYQDPNNYYVAYYDELTACLRFCVVVDGKRTQQAAKEGLKLNAGDWHALQVIVEGKRVECRLNSKKVLEAQDGTIDKPGKIGLWTKADAQTYFDDLTIRGK